ncbi:hypothetical protein D9611_007287 [Ephemerocybe angulata]|uniref:HAT C-terminal dimerisation domain-containing protein n=1 Tax=Ephemerocybe angulata TaxID=980116 RepID=A0A8H5CG51_9AGAR|nr:hypothetical protein D9611_007287 [Tulosesus angulatus]
MSDPENPLKRKRVAIPSSCVADPSNDTIPATDSHRDARAIAAAKEAAAAKERAAAAITAQPASSLPPPAGASPPPTSLFAANSLQSQTPIELDSDDEDSEPSPKKNKTLHKGKKRVVESSDEESEDEPPKKKGHRTKKKTCSLGYQGGSKGTKKGKSKSKSATTPSANSPADPIEVDDDGESSSSEIEVPVVKLSATRNIDRFFAPKEDVTDDKGETKPYRRCLKCNGDPKKPMFIVSEATTLRRHIGSKHETSYNTWCRKNNFTSKLPKHVVARKLAAEKASKTGMRQKTLDDHICDTPQLLPFTDDLFQEAAVEWLISTDQPIQALEHPRFQHMIAVAARATKGVKIPNRHRTRKYIISLFKKNLSDLRKRLLSDAVGGKISLTCDAWQASNQDAYFAVTAHWVEDVKVKGTGKTDWKLESALVGFTVMNTAHDGVRLGKALYNIVKRLGVAHKVGWITCDNASNNTTMLQQFAIHLNRRRARDHPNLKPWDYEASHIRCLAHIINLATQAVLTTYSKTEHYDPANTGALDAALETEGALGAKRDEVGLVRSATVKDLQVRKGVKTPRTLLLDMKVRWASSYIMLRRCLDLREYTDEFIYEIAREEPSFEKRAKIDGLRLTDEEWKRVEEFTSLLKQHADESQQAFSSETEPVLHNALPALEKLYKAWSSRANKPKNAHYRDALEAGAAKVSAYYTRTSTSSAYNVSMILDPSVKTTYFQKNWSQELEQDARKNTLEVFKERYIELYGTSSPVYSQPTQTTAPSRMEDVDSDNEDTAPSVPTPVTHDKPWQHEFDAYMDGNDVLGSGQSVLSWWADNAGRLPTWASLARDHLAIMASSVSSERAFSAAGITISKRRNRLLPDLVEALQFMKCHLRKDVIFREGLSSVTEAELEVVDDDGDAEWEEEIEPGVWDGGLGDDDDDVLST